MPFDVATGRMAERLLKSRFVEVYAHHDADGIAAASILCQALIRAGIGFHLRIRSRLAPEDVNGSSDILLCDFGSGMRQLSDDVMVVDHHVAHFNGPYHVNPRLFQIDGDAELSSAGAAYFVAQHMGDNRDLAGLALVGMIGDAQACIGKNHEICSEAIANGFITPRRGLRLPGRDLFDRLFSAHAPYLPGISGDEGAAAAVAAPCSDGDTTDLDCLLSRLILEIAPHASFQVMDAVYGDTYELEREIVHDAHTLSVLVDACGQAGKPGLAASLCMRSRDQLDDAWEVTRTYRLRVIESIRSIKVREASAGIYEISDASTLRGVANALMQGGGHTTPVAVIARTGEFYKISMRCTQQSGINAELLTRKITEDCGGSGGGHRLRAGAMIPAHRIGCFTQKFAEAVVS